jgi:hypothetical protein
MSSAARQRLFDRINGTEVGEVLGRAQMKTSGSKDEKLDRLLASYIQPTEVLRSLSLQSLRDIARDSHASVSGSKEELVDRLVEHYLHDLDIVAPTEAPPPRPAEPRALLPNRFRALFATLKGDDLTDILASIKSSRITGAKETKVALLDESPFCEVSLLEHLTNRALEEALSRNRLRTAGSKRDRVDRLIEHFRVVPEAMLGLEASSAGATTANLEQGPDGGALPLE